MTIKIIKYYVVLLVIFFAWTNFANANADVIINEFLSNPNTEEKEWIELLNTTNNNISLSGWKLNDLASPGGENQHEVLNKELDNLIILANGIITIDVSDLNNDGDSIGLYNNTTLIDRVTYGTESKVKNYSINLNAPLKGKSGTLISGNWVTNQEPTKNSANSENEEENEDEDIENENNNNDTSSYSSSDEEYIPLKITTKIISPKIVTAGIPFSLNSLTTTNREETYGVGRFVWNFGDGELYEVSKAIQFDYIYEYEGEYVLTLSYFDSIFSEEPEATSRITIKVIPADIYISGIGSSTDPFIELQNKSNYEIVLSGWAVTGGAHYFVIPKGTTILPGKKIKLSSKITGFGGEDIKSVTITNANKEIIATYPTLIKKPVQKSSSVRTTSNNQIPVSNLKDDSLTNDSQIISLNDLSADAGGVNINISKSTYAWIGLIFIIGLGTASFLMIKRKNNYNDYVDKEIRAEDMTIME